MSHIVDLDERELLESEKHEVDEKFKLFFDKIAGEDGEIDSFELQELFNAAFSKELNGKSFSLEACRSMSAMTDRGQRNGTIDYEEFQHLWLHLRRYKESFSKQDVDKSGDMCVEELGKALSRVGFDLSGRVLNICSARFANRDGKVDLDDFIQICCRVKTSFEAFISHSGKPLSIDEYVMDTLYT